MKLTWFRGLAAAVACAWPALSTAQDHWSQPSAIGSYQSVVSQPQLAPPAQQGGVNPANGYAQPNPSSNFGPPNSNFGPQQPSAPVYGTPTPSNSYGNNGQGYSQPTPTNFGPVQANNYGQPNASSYRYPPQMRTPPAQQVGYGNYQPGYRQDAPTYQPGHNAGPVVQEPTPQFQSLPHQNQGAPCDQYSSFGSGYNQGPVYSGSVVGNSGCNTQSNYFQGTNFGGNYYGPGQHAFSENLNCGAGDCYDGGCGIGDRGRFFQSRGNSGANWVVGANALFFARDYEDDLGVSFNSIGQYLFSTDADNNYFGGVETFISRRNCNGWGWETRFWGLFPGATNSSLFGTLYTNLTGTRQLIHPNSGRTVEEVYNRGERHEVERDNEFYNLEFNMLRNGGCYTGLFGRSVTYELLGGFRWFQFNEVFSYATFTTWPTYPSSFSYDVDVRNTLLGLQLGGRTERCLTRRLSLAQAFKVGLFNNHIAQDQCMCDNTGDFAQVWAGPYNGQDFNFMSTKNDIALLGELDLGGIYQFSNCARATFGYRAIGVSGVALGPDQIPYNFTDVQEINRINSNGSLILHGAYAGLQFCY